MNKYKVAFQTVSYKARDQGLRIFLLPAGVDVIIP